MRIAFFGSSLVSSYWNGAATYYRGIGRALAERGHAIVFHEPDAYDRQAHRDIPDPPWAEVVTWEPSPARARQLVRSVREFDVVVKTSGVGVLDAELESEVAALRGPVRIFWDVDAAATLDGLEGDEHDPLRALVPEFDLVLTYGGGDPVVERYGELGAAACVPVYNGVDPDTHYPVEPEARFSCDLAFLGNRLPDRERRVEEFFVAAASRAPARSFLLGGSGWEGKALPANIRLLGHVGTAEHNALNSTPLAVLNVTRDSMVANGWSPATRVFEAAGAAACLITDAWPGIDLFLEPGREVLVAEDGDEVAAHLEALDPSQAAAIGRAARDRVLRDHTYAQRAEQVDELLGVLTA
jgi:spore maturation protein CgeB